MSLRVYACIFGVGFHLVLCIHYFFRLTNTASPSIFQGARAPLPILLVGRGPRYRAPTSMFLCRDFSAFWVGPTPHTHTQNQKTIPLPQKVPIHPPTHAHTRTHKNFLRLERSILSPHLHFLAAHTALFNVHSVHLDHMSHLFSTCQRRSGSSVPLTN